MLTRLQDITAARRIVVKIGSALLVGGGQAREGWLTRMAGDLAVLRQAGAQVIVVSSGAIALGAARLGLAKGGRGSLADAQAAAAVGQIALADLWSRALGGEGITAAQMLLTLGDLEDRRRYLNASATLDRLLEAGVFVCCLSTNTVFTPSTVPAREYDIHNPAFKYALLKSKFEHQILTEALRRELIEELGVTIDAAHEWKITEHDYPHALVRLHWCKVFAWTGEFEMREGQQMAWQTFPLTVSPVLPGAYPVLDWLAAERAENPGATAV